MPVDPRISRYMQENGYKDLANFPEPSQMLRMTKSPNPAINITRGVMSAIEQLALAGIKKKAEGKNQEAMKKTEDQISAEDMMQFRAKIDQLKQNGFDDLASAAEITGELPKNSDILKVMNEKKQQQESQQQEQTTLSPIQMAQQASQMKLPADQTPFLSKDFQGLPRGSQSARPEELMSMAGGNVGEASKMGRSLQEDFGGDLLSVIDKWSQPDMKEQMNVQLQDVWDSYSRGEIDLETAQARAIKIKNAMTGSSTMTQGEREEWRSSGQAVTSERSDTNFVRQQEATQSSQITSKWVARQSQNEAARARYEKENAKWMKFPAEYRSKFKDAAPKEPKPLGTWDEYVEQFKDKLPYGYDFLKRLKDTEDVDMISDEQLMQMSPEDAANLSDEDFERWMGLGGE